MRTIEQVQTDLRSGDYDLSRHAFIRIGERDISGLEIRVAGAGAMIIEDYPDDKYAPAVCCWGSRALVGLCAYR